jgi:hypothetical protein
MGLEGLSVCRNTGIPEYRRAGKCGVLLRVSRYAVCRHTERPVYRHTGASKDFLYRAAVGLLAHPGRPLRARVSDVRSSPLGRVPPDRSTF